MIVLSEAGDWLAPSASADVLNTATEAARLAGCRVYFIPPDFSVCETATNALWHIPRQEYVSWADPGPGRLLAGR